MSPSTSDRGQESVPSAGETNAGSRADELLPLVYDQLRRSAARALARLPAGQTLQATALVHEAWLRVRRVAGPDWDGREQFFCAAAGAVREVLIEQARHKGTLKGDARRALHVDPDEVSIVAAPPAGNVLDLEDALRRMEELRPRLARLVSLRFFAGLTMPQIAETLRLPLRTVERDWSYASAWLRERIGRELERDDRRQHSGCRRPSPQS